MGRKAFVNDLRDAALPGRFDQISMVTSGDDDGTIKFIYQCIASREEIAVDAMVSDVSDYPSDHTYFLFTTSEGVPSTVTAAIQSAQASVAGRSVSQMLLQVSTTIGHALSGDTSLLEKWTAGDSDAMDEAELASEDESDADMWSLHSCPRHTQSKASAKDSAHKDTNSVTKARMRSDLRLAKQAGFKIGILGNLEMGGIVSVSIRNAKLGISEEAMNAWRLKRNHYLVLLIRYGNGYKNIGDVAEETSSGSSRTEFRVALCEQYKPSITEAINAFKPSHNVSVETNQALPLSASKQGGSLEQLFIGQPLNDLLTRLPAIIKYRIACSFSWTGAELFFNEMQAKAAEGVDVTQPAFVVNDHPGSQALPKVVTADHLTDKSLSQSLSLPLAAMQFLLRHFVRCTEFCLVCHCKIDTTFEALKPYVCSKPLCLYQYMALGFGPSIEWEILSQPYVVDLLISFCYAGAQGGRLKEFPVGIALKVPILPNVMQPVTASGSGWHTTPSFALSSSGPVGVTTAKPIPAKFDGITRELLLSNEAAPGSLKIGEWVAVTGKNINGAYHARVEESFHPTRRLGELIHVASSGTAPETAGPAAASKTNLVDVEVFIYDQSFDDLSDQQKQACIMCILDTVPTVTEMKGFLESNLQDLSLKKYRSRISDSALNILRWIIASNRSCIMQVDQAAASKSLGGAEDRVSGMPEWMQFRFAQGAPDKEQRFIDCVKQVSDRLKLGKYPTLFAWHGSPLANWHSIVREGLHFNDTLHGRAYGHGVYMSSHAGTSVGYSSMGFYPGMDSRKPSVSTNWRNSKLCISSALALNEVVNAPAEFVHESPHYVVDKTDWIQTRYLFVKGDHRSLGHDFGNSKPPRHAYEQDPRRAAFGDSSTAVIIPITAVSKSRRPAVVSSPQVRDGGTKRAKISEPTTQEQAERAEDDAASMMTDASDAEYLRSDDEDGDEDEGEGTQNPKADDIIQTDFIPGTLQASTLPLLAPPENASTSATKTLLNALKQTVTIQDSTPLDQLGWYIARDLITNVYQWPVEFHSFPSSIPLASDLKAVGLKSIVLEIRFSNNFPMSPPFVRVIRPRFLPFMSGGGGHVTAGGALCMELLTNSGWSPVSSLESVLLQVRMAICSTDPKPARLENWRSGSARHGLGGGGGGGGEYHVGEAVEAYKRACLIHGWQVPKEFDEFLLAKPQGMHSDA